MKHPDLFSLNEVKVHYTLGSKSKGPKIQTSKDAYDIMLENWEDIDHSETAYMLLLNRANKLIGIKCVSKGGVSGTVVDPKIVFQTALVCNASYVILLHNHPSQNLNPSEGDVQLTKKLKQAGEFLDLKMLDHIIATSDGYYSFADEGLL